MHTYYFTFRSADQFFSLPVAVDDLPTGDVRDEDGHPGALEQGIKPGIGAIQDSDTVI
jgi:hypothetical protein